MFSGMTIGSKFPIRAGFPEGVHLGNLLVTPPRPRNPRLADAFKRLGLVERTGRGIDTIFVEQLRNGRPAPDYTRSTLTDVVLVLPGGKANLNFIGVLLEEENKGRPLRLEELLVLNYIFRERRIDVGTIVRLIQKNEVAARSVVEGLVERGFLERRGERGARTYHLSGAIYRRLGQKSAYVRIRGFEPEQQRQMIIQYARKHGKITRGEVAELCRISELQASRLLRTLVADGYLELRSEGRGAYYEPKDHQ